MLSAMAVVASAQIQVVEHLDVAASAGTMGLTLEASTPVTDWMSVRAGLSWMPTITTTMGFGVQVGDKEENKYDQNGNRIETKFDKMSGFLESFTGYRVNDCVDMDCEASFVNAKVMFDFTPFSNKDWHLTAGFYWGTKIIGRACNSTVDMNTTLAVNMYNNMYDKIYNFEPIISVPGYENLGMSFPPELEDKIIEYGRMGMHLGEFKSDGSAYMMVPQEDGTVRAKAKVNSFKPYIGFGWSHQMSKFPKWTYGVDAGMIFWGGVPNVYTHDGTSLTKDLKNVKGKVGDIIDLIDNFPVYPLVEIKISRRIF